MDQETLVCCTVTFVLQGKHLIEIIIKSENHIANGNGIVVHRKGLRKSTLEN